MSNKDSSRAPVVAPQEDVNQRRMEIALRYIKRAANRQLPTLPCRVDEMTEREAAIFNVCAAASGNLQFIARELDAMDSWAPSPSSPVPPEQCAKCGGSGEIEIGCAMDHAITAPCVECGGTGTARHDATPSPSLAARAAEETGWLLEKMHNGNVHYISVDNVLQWTDDPNKALRLARKGDAEALCTIVEDCEKIASHEWVPSVPAAGGDEDKSKVEQTIDQWRSQLTEASTVSDEDAEDLTLRMLALVGK